MRYAEHSIDVLTTLSNWISSGRTAALVIITGTIGGAVRRPGAMMAVCENGDISGYISGGCIDADVAAHAQTVIQTNTSLALRYGVDSPFVDLPLPCGGAIDVTIIPPPKVGDVEAMLKKLKDRKPITIGLFENNLLALSKVPHPTGWDGDTFFIRVPPKLRLRIAGRGADCLALARLAEASDIETILWLLDADDAENSSTPAHALLQTTSTIPQSEDDPYTAFVLMFHDPDWETPLLRQALDGPAFFIGAVGSPNTHAKRCTALQQDGLPRAQIDRIVGPIGLIPSMRDSSTLAVSALSQIVDVYHRRAFAPESRTAICLLAAGASSRFQNGDKLMASFQGTPLLSQSAQLNAKHFGASIAIVGPDHHDRKSLLERFGWTVIENTRAREGQATSVQAAIRAAAAIESIDQALIVLGDMPHITHAHLDNLISKRTDQFAAVFSDTGETLMPPAIFSRHTFEHLLRLDGDVGAKHLANMFVRTTTCKLDPSTAGDVDTVEHLTALEAANA